MAEETFIANGQRDSGLSTGAKPAIGVVIPIVVIGLMAGALLLFRRRKRKSAASNRHVDADAPELVGPHIKGPVPITAGSGDTDKDAYGRVELHNTSLATQAPDLHPTPHQHAARADADELPGNPAIISSTTGSTRPQRHTTDLAGSPTTPATAAELSDNDRWSYPQELSNTNSDWSHMHELAAGPRSVYSDDRTLASKRGGRDEYLEELKAKRAAVNEEWERLRRMEMLREEDERLEREIEEYEKTRG